VLLPIHEKESRYGAQELGGRVPLASRSREHADRGQFWHEFQGASAFIAEV